MTVWNLPAAASGKEPVQFGAVLGGAGDAILDVPMLDDQAPGSGKALDVSDLVLRGPAEVVLTRANRATSM